MECYQQLLLEHKVIGPHAIKTLYLGETKIDNTLLGLIDYYNNNMKTILSWGTLKKPKWLVKKKEKRKLRIHRYLIFLTLLYAKREGEAGFRFQQ